MSQEESDEMNRLLKLIKEKEDEIEELKRLLESLNVNYNEELQTKADSSVEAQ